MWCYNVTKSTETPYILALLTMRLIQPLADLLGISAYIACFHMMVSQCDTGLGACDTVGTIIKRRRKDGTPAYMARVRIKVKGKVVHSETATFERRPSAAAWIAKREGELSMPGGVDRAKTGYVSLGDAIDRYISERKRPIRRTKNQVLNWLKTHEISSTPCDLITSEGLVGLARDLSRTRTPQTVSAYLTHLSPIFSVAKPAWGYALDKKQWDDALIVMRQLGLTGKAENRNRRPTFAELDKLMHHFLKLWERQTDTIPMHLIVPFAIFSTRRQEEITRIRWNDLEPGRVLVRDMKDPSAKDGNDVWCDLPIQAEKIISLMPKDTDEIFPFNAQSVSSSFTRACFKLKINLKDMPDSKRLHFHDLRHDGISRLFEMGRTIPQAASVSGHRSWSSLKRYTHIRQTGDKYAGWKWLDVITK